MKRWWFEILVASIVLVNVLSNLTTLRLDLTTDRRYTLSATTRELLRSLSSPIEASLYLNGELNSGFRLLRSTTKQTIEEMAHYANIKFSEVKTQELTEQQIKELNTALEREQLHPTAIYETNRHGKSSQTIVYPFIKLTAHGKTVWVNLLENQRGLSGAENLNNSQEYLEYKLGEAIYLLGEEEPEKIAFIEGQGELPEQNTADIEQALSKYFAVYRGTITQDVQCLSPFAAIIFADPQLPFTEADKYIIDQYLMHGGKALWCVNGVQFSQNVLTDQGFTPVLPLDLNLTDLFFRYGVRVNAHLLQDRQCLPVPVDVSQNPDIPQYQPMPWYYNPMLLTSSQSAITRNLTAVSAPFCSDIEAVGKGERLNYDILLATSDAARIIPIPAEVRLSETYADPSLFTYSYLPVAMAVEGIFNSHFTHRMQPDGLSGRIDKLTESVPTRQVFIAAGSVPRNELQNGNTLPAGYDRYSHLQPGNRDMIVNSILWLTDKKGLINLRQKTIPLRLLNDKLLQQKLTSYQAISILTPLLLIALIALIVNLTYKKTYTT